MSLFKDYPLPKQYDILKGYFFDRDYNNGKKEDIPLYTEKQHYMLVLNVLKKSNKLIVCLGTSAKSYYSYSDSQNNLWITDSNLKGTGLYKKTLFCLHGSNIGIIDCSSFYLDRLPKKSEPSFGELNHKTIETYEDIKKNNPQILQIMKYIATEGYQMLPPELLNDNRFKLDAPWENY